MGNSTSVAAGPVPLAQVVYCTCVMCDELNDSARGCLCRACLRAGIVDYVRGVRASSPDSEVRRRRELRKPLPVSSARPRRSARDAV